MFHITFLIYLFYLVLYMNILFGEVMIANICRVSCSGVVNIHISYSIKIYKILYLISRNICTEHSPTSVLVLCNISSMRMNSIKHTVLKSVLCADIFQSMLWICYLRQFFFSIPEFVCAYGGSFEALHLIHFIHLMTGNNWKGWKGN